MYEHMLSTPHPGCGVPGLNSVDSHLQVPGARTMRECNKCRIYLNSKMSKPLFSILKLGQSSPFQLFLLPTVGCVGNVHHGILITHVGNLTLIKLNDQNSGSRLCCSA